MRWSKNADVSTLLRLLAGYGATGVLPRTLDRRILRRLLASRLLIRDGLIDDVADRMRLVLGDALTPAEAGAAARDWAAMLFENRWLRWRALHRADPPVETSVDGLQHLEAALAERRGAILWGMEFCDTLVVKIALHRAGVRLVHLSTANHGLAAPPTWLGLRIASPLHCAAENRFLDERVIIPADGSLGYMRVLVQRLEENRCVWISGERRSARQNVAADLLGGEALFAPGAPGLAWKLGSALLPVHVVRTAPMQYRAIIDEPICPDRSGDKDAFIADAVRQFAVRVGRRIRERPAGWSWYGHSVEKRRAAASQHAPHA